MALGNPFLICGETKGETIVRRIRRQLDNAGRTRLLGQCAQALAAIHRANPNDPGLIREDQPDEWRGRLDAMTDTTATFEWAFRWLAANRPAPSPPRLMHGDYRMGNLIAGGSELAAVLDWELVHIGEVYEDLAWFCIRAWRFGSPADRAAGGLGSVEDFLAAYEHAGGAAIDLPPRAAAEKSADFLTEELDARLASEPVRFSYQVQVAADGDSTVDPSKPWHSTQTVTVGTVEITGADTEREHGGDIVVFDPVRVTDGIKPSNDPVLRFRSLVYSASMKLRIGVDRGPEAPALRALVRRRLAVAHPGYDRQDQF